MSPSMPPNRGSLGRVLLRRVLAFSLGLLALVSAVQVLAGYHLTLASAEKSLEDIESRYRKGLATALWDSDEIQLQAQFEGILQFPYVTHVAAGHLGRTILEGGQPSTQGVISREFPITRLYNGRVTPLGTITIQASKRMVWREVVTGAARMVALYAAMIAAMAFFLLLLFQGLVTRHLADAAEHFRATGVEGLDQPLRLDKVRRGDELDTLADAFNSLTAGLRSAYRELVSSMQSAEAASRAKSDFLANMSHEIRTPLNGVIGMLQLLQTTPTSPEQREYLRAALQSSKRLTLLLADILDLSRIEAGKMQMQDAEFEVVRLKESILELFALAKEKRLDLEFAIDPRLPRVLCGDEARLRQILFNLTGNAIKFTRQGHVRVEASPLPSPPGSGLRVLFMVSDSGIGIPDNLVPDIFEPFMQVENSYRRRFQGAGLGLSIVRKLVRLMDGELAVESTEGVGTTMYLSLPLHTPRTPSPPPGPLEPAPRPPAGTALRVLLVEDDEVSRQAGLWMLKKAGHVAHTAGNGVEALRFLAELEVDLVLMDIQMPEMDGMEATRAIRNGAAGEGASAIPIIAMTAYAMAGDQEKFLAAGITGYLAKPVSMDDLYAAMDRAMAGRPPGGAPAKA